MKTKLMIVCALILLAFSCSSAQKAAAKEQLNQGAKLFNEQKYTEAIAVFEKVLEKDPENTKALYNIAISYIQLKNDDKALIYLRETVRIGPFYEDAWYNIAYMLYKKGDFKGAVEAGYNGGTDAENIVKNSITKLKEQGVDIPVTTQPTTIMGALDKNTINLAVKKYEKEYEKCYKTTLLQDPELEGRLVINFIISAEGKITSAKVLRTTIDNTTLESCIVGITKKIEFPKPKGGGIVIVNYPFVFRPVHK